MTKEEREVRAYLEGQDCPVPSQCFAGLPGPHKQQRYSPKKIANALLAVLDVEVDEELSEWGRGERLFRKMMISAAHSALIGRKG